MAWLSFGAVHSILAVKPVKNLLEPWLGRAYRFAYNLFALFHIGLVIYGGQYLIGGNAVRFHYSPVVLMALQGIMILGATIFVTALSQYDLGRFSGLTQLLKGNGEAGGEPLHLTGLHRFVRHPLYSGVHLYIWSTVRTEFDLATAIWASAYLIIGSHFEERKLIMDYGDAYRTYMDNVPAVIPWRGRAV